MKRILLTSLILVSYCAISQQLPLLERYEQKKVLTPKNETFKAISNKAEAYFSRVDTDKKGSGYKPFKRWEYRWSHYLQEDGTIAPAEHLWKAWQQKNVMSKKTSSIFSNWTDQGPFDQSSKSGQGRLNTVVVDPNTPTTIYVGAPAGGLWKSADDGVNWTPLTDYLPQIGVSGIAIDPNNSNIIYISTGDDDAGDSYSIGVLKSTDGGNTWNTTGNIAGNPISSNEIVIDPSDSNRIWVATANGLFLSEDAGASWIQKQSGHIRDFKLKPDDPNTIYAVSSNRFYKSTNGGGSFQIISSNLPAPGSLGRLRVEVTLAAPNNVYVLGAKTSSQNWAFEGMYISTNSGQSFTKTDETDDIFRSTQAWYDLALAVSDSDPDIIHVGVLDIWKSTNNGDNFTKSNDWRIVNESFTHADIHFMRYYNGILYVGTDGGVFRSTDQGVTFTDLTQDLSISQFYKGTVSKRNSTKLAGGLQDNGGFAFSNNIWHNYHGGDGMDSASDPNDENTFYGFQQFGDALSVTNDGGLTSNQFFVSGPSQGNWVTPLTINKSSELYAGYNQLYRLVNNSSFAQVSNHNFGGNLEAIEIDPSNTNNIFVSRGTTLFISNDKGVTFTTRTSTQTGIAGVNISSIEVHSSNSNIVWVTTSGTGNSQFPSSGNTGGGVYKSTDGGLTFTNITDNLPDESKFIVRHHPFTTNNSIYVGTALGVYHRNDDINTWEVYSTNLPNTTVSDLEINPYDNTITAFTYGRSVWQSPIPSVTLPENEADLIAIASPNNSIVCGNVSSSINITNNGTNPLTSLAINYNIDGNTDQVFNWSGNIASNASGTIELPSITATEGSHTFNVEIIQAEDANLFNNSSSTTFEVNQSARGQIIYTFGDTNPNEDQNNGAWFSSESLWEIGAPTTTDFNDLVASGYVTNPSGNYSDNTRAFLTSPCYNMSTLVNPILKFKMAFDIELNWDVLYMEYSIDEGASWQVLGTASDANWYNSNFRDPGRVLTIGSQWTGTDATLKEYSYDLADFTNESSMMFRFVFASDQAVNEEGVVVDDFTIDGSQVPTIDDLDTSSFAIYPNPSENIFNIKRGDFLDEKMNIKVYDITGKLILDRNDIINNDYPLDMSNVSKGVYFMRLAINNKSLIKKLILK